MSAEPKTLDAGGVLVLIDEVLELFEDLPLDRKITVLCAACGVVVADHTEAESTAKREALVQIFAKNIAGCAGIVLRNRAMPGAQPQVAH